MGKNKRPAQFSSARLAAPTREELEVVRAQFERALAALQGGNEPATEDLASLDHAGSAATHAAAWLLAHLPETGALNLLELLRRLEPAGLHELIKEAAFSEEFSLAVKAAMVALLEQWQDPQAYLCDEIERARAAIGLLQQHLESSPFPQSERERLHAAVREFSSFTRRSFVRQVALDLGPQAVAAYEVLSEADPEFDRDLVGILESSRAPQAALALAQMLRQATSKEMRKTIKRALHKLESAGVPVPELEQEPVVLAPPPKAERRAHSSHIDSLGDRLIWYARFQPPEGLVVAQALVNDHAGLGNFEIFKSSRKSYRQMLSNMKSDEMMTVAELDPDHALSLIDQAAARTRELGKEVPEEYARHRELLGAATQLPPQPPAYRRFGVDEIERLRRDRARAAAALEVREISGWMIHLRELESYYERIAAAQKSPIITSEFSKEERLDGLYREITDEFFTSPKGSLYRRRLEEMADLLAALGRQDDARAALAAALSLEGAPHDSPFATGLMQRCLDLIFELQKKNEQGSLIVSPYDASR